MDDFRRAGNYQDQTGRRLLTPRQARRIRKKQNAAQAAQRRAAGRKP